MGLNEDLKEFSLRIKNIKDSISNEESTKTSIILPFFSLLGYDVFNPLEFIPEFVADVGIKKGEKVDYAILNNGEPIILIEAKSINKKLEKHDSQLFRYFSTTNAKFAILTNGINYRFYTDLDEPNKMDREPFYEFNLLNLSDDDISEIKKLSKTEFDKEKIFENASILKYSGIFKSLLQTSFSNPSDDLVRLFLKDYYKGVKTQNVVDKFKPVLRKAINDFVEELVKERLTNIISNSEYSESVSLKENKKQDPTDLEFDIIVLIKSLLNDFVDMNDITYKKTESYLAILLKNNTRKWIARIIANDSQITLIIPDSNKLETKYKIATIDEIERYKEQLISSLNNYLNINDSSTDTVQYVYTKWGKYPMPDPYKVYIKRGLPPFAK